MSVSSMVGALAFWFTVGGCGFLAVAAVLGWTVAGTGFLGWATASATFTAMRRLAVRRVLREN